jgi:hypothetical protein
MKRRLRWPFRPRHVDLDDKRSPMVRLLQDCKSPDGSIQPNYEQQFRTLFKAERLGYVDDRYFLTPAGREFLGGSQQEFA